MAGFSRGVEYYTTLKGVIAVNFPENDVSCQWCPFCRSEKDVGRFWCRLNNEMLYSPNYRGDKCPLKEEEE